MIMIRRLLLHQCIYNMNVDFILIPDWKIFNLPKHLRSIFVYYVVQCQSPMLSSSYKIHDLINKDKTVFYCHSCLNRMWCIIFLCIPLFNQYVTDINVYAFRQFSENVLIVRKEKCIYEKMGNFTKQNVLLVVAMLVYPLSFHNSDMHTY